MSHFAISRFSHRTRALLVGLLLIPVGACGSYETGADIPDEARVVVTGTAPEPLELVTSTKFTRTFHETGEFTISLVFADTVFLTLDPPHDQAYPIKPDWGFFVRLKNPVMDPAVVSMQVFFDGELVFEHQEVTLEEDILEFSQVFEGGNVIW